VLGTLLSSQTDDSTTGRGAQEGRKYEYVTPVVEHGGQPSRYC